MDMDMDMDMDVDMDMDMDIDVYHRPNLELAWNYRLPLITVVMYCTVLYCTVLYCTGPYIFILMTYLLKLSQR